jgi:hypothetical protein
MSERVVCRKCGRRYLEDAGDPCPGLCAPCFGNTLVADMFEAWRERSELGLSVRECLVRSQERLRAAGMTPAALAYQLAHKQTMLAEELAAERRAN